jgi:hypothetical protein
MNGGEEEPKILGESFFEGRWLVEIEAWNCPLFVRLSSAEMPREYTFQNGIDLGRTIDIQARVRAPAQHRGQNIQIHLTPVGPEHNEWDEVGRLYFSRPEQPRLNATLLIPEATVPLAATCLSSIWRYVHIWTFDADADEASVSGFSFGTKIHKNLAAWVDG